MSQRPEKSRNLRAALPRPVIRGVLEDNDGRAVQNAAWEAMGTVQRLTGRTAAEWEQWHKDQRRAA